MAINQARSTKSQAKGSIAVSTKKRNVIYIDQYDPRNNIQYISSHPGQIVVLSDAEFAKYLKQEIGGTADNPANGLLLNDNESITDFANAISDIRPPGTPKWNTSDISYFTTDTGSYENITITFDPSPDDPLDGSFTYHVNYYPGTLSTNTPSSTTLTPTTNTPVTGSGSSGSQVTSSQTSAGSTTPVGTITTVNHTTSFFAIEWKALPNATNYTVTVTGWDIPGQPSKVWTHSYVVSASGGAAPNSHYGVGSLAFGIYTFTLTAATGFQFTGTYSISVQANYGTTSSKGVSHSVTI